MCVKKKERNLVLGVGWGLVRSKLIRFAVKAIFANELTKNNF